MSKANAKTEVGPLAGGWELVSPSAVKLWYTLRGLPHSSTTIEQISRVAGLSPNTTSAALIELAHLGWLRYSTQRGAGIDFAVLAPARQLTADAKSYYKWKLQSAQSRLDDRKRRLDAADDKMKQNGN